AAGARWPPSGAAACAPDTVRDRLQSRRSQRDLAARRLPRGTHRRGERVTGNAQLVKRDAQHVAVDARHLIDRELGGELRDLDVELLAMLEHPLDEIP